MNIPVSYNVICCLLYSQQSSSRMPRWCRNRHGLSKIWVWSKRFSCAVSLPPPPPPMERKAFNFSLHLHVCTCMCCLQHFCSTKIKSCLSIYCSKMFSFKGCKSSLCLWVLCMYVCMYLIQLPVGEVREAGKREVITDSVDHSHLDRLDNSQQVRYWFHCLIDFP